MKKIGLFLIALLLGSAMYAQVFDDFESNVHQWDNVSCFSEVRDNPHQEGLNLSCKCLYLMRAPGCDNWSGAIVNPVQVQGTYRYVHVLMYRNNTNRPNLKVSDNAVNGVTDLVPMNAVAANQWQDVVFDIQGYSLDFIMLMVDRTELTSDAEMYVDDILLSNDPAPRTTPNTACQTPDQPEPTPTEDGYTLVWNQDFTSTELDRSVWNIEVNGDGGGNNELQYYCEKAVTLGIEPETGKHCLILTATKEEYNGKHCTSGRVNTNNHAYFTYGKIEARIKFPKTANGLWPAFWMMGEDIDEVGWPRCGETDIIELGNAGGFNGNQERFFNGASHWGARVDNHIYAAKDIVNPYSVEDTFHIITCIWDAEHVAMYVDRDAHPNAEPYYTLDITPSNNDQKAGYYFHKPNFVLFNLAVGGNFPSIWEINGITALANGPRSMYIDWLRIYQKGDANETFHAPVPSDPLEEGEQGGEQGGATSLSRPTIENTATKVFRNGQLYILRNGVIYNTLGQIVK